MRKAASLLFLGTGGSMGIPMIGCTCHVCTSTNPYNQRLRPSALLTHQEKKILIDCSPDYRFQALRYGIVSLDGVIFTHGHNDHTAGIDELRVYRIRSKQAIPCLLSNETAEELKQRFKYIFMPHGDKLISKFDLQILPAERGQVEFLQFPIQYFSYKQSDMKVTGFRFGSLAFVTDIRDYPNTIFEDLQGVDTLVLSALRMTPSHLHFSLDEAVDFATKVGAKQTWLTHLAHEVDHEKGNAYLPEKVRLAYDGLELPFDWS